ncbi:stage II sporulation protein M [Kiloniella laminariae]|uniref:stage II sporulation protein M n=1 Tax=Kiloniella laminariae TaxID=454162 RepID=UPI0003602B8A|nr:stage II sporulation protein M [Kiloniella laminariae]
MSEFALKSSRFRAERESSWKELQALVERVEKQGLTSLSAEELTRLPNLYRFTLSSLSVARGVSLDRNLLEYLELLSTRAYFCIYGVRASFGGEIIKFLAEDFPAAVWQVRWRTLASTLIFCLAAFLAFYLTNSNEEWYYTFVSDGMSSGRTPATSTEDLRKALYDGGDANAGDLNWFASYLFSNNASVGMLSFALGFALGVPTVMLIFYNGAVLGAFVALYVGRGLGLDIAAWLSIHGTTELLAIILCGAAGLGLAKGIISPGRESRLANLAREGREAGKLVIGCVLMLLIAALLEAFGRQWITDITLRLVIGGGLLLFWLGYFGYLGRKVCLER